MITRDELLAQAEAFDLSEANVQRDYLFGWLIAGIFRESQLAATVVLKGGNALRKGYFPGTRFSDDLDFSSPNALDADNVLRELNRVCDFVGDATGVHFDIDRNRLVGEQQIDRDKHAYKYKLYFKDFIGDADDITISVRVDVTEFDQLYLPPQERQLIHPYSDADSCATMIRCVKLEEALADKLKCLLQRRYCYDVFDLVYGAFIARDIAIDRGELMNVFLRKTIFGSGPGAARELLLGLPTELFRGFWGRVVVPAAGRMSFDDAILALRAGVEDLFAPYGQGEQRELAFYPSRLRNPILEAGSERRLLRLTYDGLTRTVEPYSLEFKRRRDGQANEYLYVWDRTGGRSEPGTKALFHFKITDLEILDETFEPQFEIALAKAGDVGQSGRFIGNRGPRGPRAFRRPRSFGPKYIVQCSACGKQFTRTTNNTTMNSHKNPWGSPCHSRYGFLVRLG